MGEPPDLSICIVNWNGKQMLLDLLRSIDRTKRNLSVQTIVIDNASSDGSAEAVAADFPQVQVVRNQTNEGFAAANNRGTALARAPLLLFLNNDTVLHEGALQNLTAFLDDHLECSAVGPRLVNLDGSPQISGRNLPTIRALLNRLLILRWTKLFKKDYQAYRRSDFDPEKGGPIPQLAAAALLVRKKDLLNVGSWDERFPFGVEDVDLCTRLNQLGTIYYLADTTITHLGRISSRANSPFVFSGYELGYAHYVSKLNPIVGVVYKILFTIDLPIRAIGYALQYLVNSKLLKKRENAESNLNDLRSCWGFLSSSMPALWRM